MNSQIHLALGLISFEMFAFFEGAHLIATSRGSRVLDMLGGIGLFLAGLALLAYAAYRIHRATVKFRHRDDHAASTVMN